MSKDLMRLKEIAERKAELRTEVKDCEDRTRLDEIEAEAEQLAHEERTIRTKMLLVDDLESEVQATRTSEITKEERFAKENRMTMPLFKEGRALLVSSGKLATPTAVETEIEMLQNAVSSIIDDVDVVDATGTGAWKFPYEVSEATAAAVTEGQAIGGTEGEFDFIEITPTQWGTFSEVSAQVKKMTPVGYYGAVQKQAVYALRAKGKETITRAILASNLTKKVPSIKLDADYLRTIVFGFGGKESVGGGTKLYINRADLVALGKVRTPGEKLAHYKIAFTDENNGTIEENGISIPFSINDSVPTGEQLYGQPKSVKLLLWDNYTVETDESGQFFKNNTLAVRGLQTAGADLVVPEGFHRIGQGTLA